MNKPVNKSTPKPIASGKPAVAAVPAKKERKKSEPRPIAKQANASLNALSRAINGLGKSLRGLDAEAMVSELRPIFERLSESVRAIDPAALRPRATAVIPVYQAGDRLELTKTGAKTLAKFAGVALTFVRYGTEDRVFAVVSSPSGELTMPSGFLRRPQL